MLTDPQRSGDQYSWRSCWPTADETTVSFCCPLDDGPWLVGRALDVLRHQGGVEPDPHRQRYVSGTKKGAPLILGEPLRWHGMPVVMEACQATGQATGEVTFRLPPWAHMAEHLAEDTLWSLVDALGSELGAHCAVLSDGRAVGYPDLADIPQAAARLQLSHLGVLVPPGWLSSLRPGSSPYLTLQVSELVVVLE